MEDPEWRIRSGYSESYYGETAPQTAMGAAASRANLRPLYDTARPRAGFGLEPSRMVFGRIARGRRQRLDAATRRWRTNWAWMDPT